MASFVASVDFEGNCVSQVSANRLALQAVPMDAMNRKMAFFPQTVPQPADGPASQGGYATTITEKQIGGCNGGGTTAVYLDGVVIANVTLPTLTPSVDLNGTGYCDAGDIAVFATSNGRCQGEAGYDACANLVLDTPTQCINQGDLDVLGMHLGHNWTSPISKVESGLGTVTKLLIEPDASPVTASVRVRLEGLQERSAVGVVLRPAANKLQFTAWTPEPQNATTAFAVAGADEQGSRLALLVLNVAPDATGVVELGRLTFIASAGEAVTTADLPVSYEDVATFDASIASVVIDRRQTMNETPRITTIAQNYPNPCNPSTVIRYTLSQDAPVRLTIYDVAGREVRTLINHRQPAGEHAVVWDGRHGSGRNASSGIYVYRLATGDFTGTKKLVLIQ